MDSTFGKGISIHALREEGDQQRVSLRKAHLLISIHALREEGDTPGQKYKIRKEISIHALREEGDAWVNPPNTW